MAGTGQHFTNLDIFTDDYRVTGRVRLPASGGLIAELNDPEAPYLVMEDAYLSRIHAPGKIVINYSHAAFRKSNIYFIVLQDRQDGMNANATNDRPSSLHGKPAKAFLTLPSFEVKGEIMYADKPEPSAILIHSPGRFQSIFSARASASL